MPLGAGVPRRSFPKDRSSPISREKPRAAVSKAAVWEAKPTLEYQIHDPELCQSTGRTTRIFDLSKPEELEKWNQLQTEASSPMATFCLVDAAREFCKSTENWKLMVTVETMKFRQLLPPAALQAKSGT